MKRRLLPLPFVLFVLLAPLLDSQLALACFVGSDFNPATSADVIVEGRITGWEDIEDAIDWNPKTDPSEVQDSPDFYGPYDAIRLHLEVDRVLKGEVPERIELVSGNTLTTIGGERHWVGSSGACGAFGHDPTGRWSILGLAIDQHGRYVPSLPPTFFVGDDPGAGDYAQAMDRLSEFGEGQPGFHPDGYAPGAPPQEEPAEHTEDTPWAIILPLAFAIPLAVLFVPAFLHRRGSH